MSRHEDNERRARKQREDLLIRSVDGIVEREAQTILFRFKGVDHDELVSTGRFSLVRAVALYVPDPKTTWENYARQYIRGAMMRVVRTVHRRHRQELLMFRASCRLQAAYRDDFNILDHDDEELRSRLVAFFETIATMAITVSEDDAARDPEGMLEEVESAHELRDALGAAIRSMPDGQRKILKLVYLDDHDIEHTAPLLGVHRNTAYNWHTRAIETLRRAVRSLGIRRPPPMKRGPLLDFEDMAGDPPAAG